MNKYIFNKIISAILATTCVVTFTSCAREISADQYAAHSIGETSTTYPGVIVHAREVKVQAHEELDQNSLGIVGGGIAGACGGSAISNGDNALATIGGAIVGATAGALAEKALRSQTGVEYVVQLNNGEAKTVVQGTTPAYSVGQNVYLIISHKGRSRLIAR